MSPVSLASATPMSERHRQEHAEGEINRGMKMRSGFILPEEQQHGLRECLEVVVPVDLRVVPQRYFTKHLRRGKQRN